MFAKRFRILFQLRTPCVLLILLWPSVAYSLPWDVDMYSQQSLKPNEIARAPAKGTVPLGRRPFTMSMEDAAKHLKNPYAGNADSVSRGKRLWSINCLTCHGVKGKGDGPVGTLMGIPDITTVDYKDGRADGGLYTVIHRGQGRMPRYGYKFSDDEIWALVNYLRFLQGNDVPGMKR